MANINTTVKTNFTSSGAAQAQGAIQGVAAATNRLGNASASAGRGFSAQARGLGGLVGAYAAAAATIFALQQSFAALNKAAQAEQTIAGTRALAVAIGESGSQIIKNLQDITRGQLSMAAAAESANLSLSSGFNTKQISDLADIATKASRALGRDLTDAMNRLTKGTAKLEPELLDELGIFTRLDPAVEAYASKMNKAVGSLTQFERRQAFANAVIEEGKRKFEAIDTTIPNAAESLQKLSAALIDIGLKFGGFIANALQPFIDFLTKDAATAAALFAGVLALVFRKAFSEIGKGIENIALKTNDFLSNAITKYSNFGDKAKGALSDLAKETESFNKARVLKSGTSIDPLETKALIDKARASSITYTETQRLTAALQEQNVIRQHNIAAMEKQRLILDVTSPKLVKLSSDIDINKQVIAKNTEIINKSAAAAAQQTTAFAFLQRSVNVTTSALATFGRVALGAFGWVGIAISAISTLSLLSFEMFGYEISLKSILKPIGDFILELLGVTDASKNVKAGLQGLSSFVINQFSKDNFKFDVNNILDPKGNKVSIDKFKNDLEKAYEDIDKQRNILERSKKILENPSEAPTAKFVAQNQLIASTIAITNQENKLRENYKQYPELVQQLVNKFIAVQKSMPVGIASIFGEILKDTGVSTNSLISNFSILEKEGEAFVFLSKQLGIETKIYSQELLKTNPNLKAINDASYTQLTLLVQQSELQELLHRGNVSADELAKRSLGLITSKEKLQQQLLIVGESITDEDFKRFDAITKQNDLLRDQVGLQVALDATVKNINDTFGKEIALASKLNGILSLNGELARTEEQVRKNQLVDLGQILKKTEDLNNKKDTDLSGDDKKRLELRQKAQQVIVGLYIHTAQELKKINEELDKKLIAEQKAFNEAAIEKQITLLSNQKNKLTELANFTKEFYSTNEALLEADVRLRQTTFAAQITDIEIKNASLNKQKDIIEAQKGITEAVAKSRDMARGLYYDFVKVGQELVSELASGPLSALFSDKQRSDIAITIEATKVQEITESVNRQIGLIKEQAVQNEKIINIEKEISIANLNSANLSLQSEKLKAEYDIAKLTREKELLAIDEKNQLGIIELEKQLLLANEKLEKNKLQAQFEEKNREIDLISLRFDVIRAEAEVFSGFILELAKVLTRATIDMEVAINKLPESQRKAKEDEKLSAVESQIKKDIKQIVDPEIATKLNLLRTQVGFTFDQVIENLQTKTTGSFKLQTTQAERLTYLNSLRTATIDKQLVLEDANLNIILAKIKSNEKLTEAEEELFTKKILLTKLETQNLIDQEEVRLAQAKIGLTKLKNIAETTFNLVATFATTALEGIRKAFSEFSDGVANNLLKGAGSLAGSFAKLGDSLRESLVGASTKTLSTFINRQLESAVIEPLTRVATDILGIDVVKPIQEQMLEELKRIVVNTGISAKSVNGGAIPSDGTKAKSISPISLGLSLAATGASLFYERKLTDQRSKVQNITTKLTDAESKLASATQTLTDAKSKEKAASEKLEQALLDQITARSDLLKNLNLSADSIESFQGNIDKYITSISTQRSALEELVPAQFARQEAERDEIFYKKQVIELTNEKIKAEKELLDTQKESQKVITGLTLALAAFNRVGSSTSFGGSAGSSGGGVMNFIGNKIVSAGLDAVAKPLLDPIKDIFSGIARNIITEVSGIKDIVLSGFGIGSDALLGATAIAAPGTISAFGGIGAAAAATELGVAGGAIAAGAGTGGAAAAGLAAIGGPVAIAAIAGFVLMSLFGGKKPSVGPNGGIAFKGGQTGPYTNGTLFSDNNADIGLINKLSEAFTTSIEFALTKLGASFTGPRPDISSGYFKNHFYAGTQDKSDYRSGFKEAEQAIAYGVATVLVEGATKGTLSAKQDVLDYLKGIKNLTTETFDSKSFDAGIEFADKFDELILKLKGGAKTFADLAINIEKSSKMLAIAKATEIKNILADTKKYFPDVSSTVTLSGGQTVTGSVIDQIKTLQDQLSKTPSTITTTRWDGSDNGSTTITTDNTDAITNLTNRINALFTANNIPVGTDLASVTTTTTASAQLVEAQNAVKTFALSLLGLKKDATGTISAINNTTDSLSTLENVFKAQFKTIKENFKNFDDVLKTAGFSADEIARIKSEGEGKVIRQLSLDFVEGVTDAFNFASNPELGPFGKKAKDLIAAQEDRLKAAQVVIAEGSLTAVESAKLLETIQKTSQAEIHNLIITGTEAQLRALEKSDDAIISTSARMQLFTLQMNTFNESAVKATSALTTFVNGLKTDIQKLTSQGSNSLLDGYTRSAKIFNLLGTQFSSNAGITGELTRFLTITQNGIPTMQNLRNAQQVLRGAYQDGTIDAQTYSNGLELITNELISSYQRVIDLVKAYNELSQKLTETKNSVRDFFFELEDVIESSTKSIFDSYETLFNSFKDQTAELYENYDKAVENVTTAQDALKQLGVSGTKDQVQALLDAVNSQLSILDVTDLETFIEFSQLASKQAQYENELKILNSVQGKKAIDNLADSQNDLLEITNSLSSRGFDLVSSRIKESDAIKQFRNSLNTFDQTQTDLTNSTNILTSEGLLNFTDAVTVSTDSINSLATALGSAKDAQTLAGNLSTNSELINTLLNDIKKLNEAQNAYSQILTTVNTYSINLNNTSNQYQDKIDELNTTLQTTTTNLQAVRTSLEGLNLEQTLGVSLASLLTGTTSSLDTLTNIIVTRVNDAVNIINSNSSIRSANNLYGITTRPSYGEAVNAGGRRESEIVEYGLQRGTLNRILARVSGYTGVFGTGGWNAFAQANPQAAAAAQRAAEDFGRSYAGFATGTNLFSGDAIVGENGPELIRLRRPGQVFNNHDTMNMLRNNNNNTPNVEINVINNGAPQEVESQNMRMDGDKLVVDVVLRDLRSNGPIYRKLKGKM